MKLLTVIFALLFIATLFGNEININTPDGSFSIQISESSDFSSDGRTNSGVIIDNIALKLEELDKGYITKLARLDKARADKIMNEIFALLALLPVDSAITVEQKAVTTSTTTTTQKNSSIPGLNINLNIKETFTQEQQKPTQVIEREEEKAPVRKPLSDSDFQKLVRSIKEESFSDDQLRIIRLSARTAFYTVNQIIQVIDIMSFSDDKIEALSIMYPRVTDPENAHKIPNAFTYSDDKQKAEGIISQ